MATRATIASTLDGNSGVVDVATSVTKAAVLVVLVLATVTAGDVVVDLLALAVVEDDVLEDVVEVVTAPGEYVKVTTSDAVAPLPPQVAFTVNVPAIHAAFPPGTDVSLKLPVETLGKTSLMSARLPAGFVTVMMTAVFGPGAGETTPVMWIGWSPEYEGASVWRVMV